MQYALLNFNVQLLGKGLVMLLIGIETCSGKILSMITAVFRLTFGVY